MISGTAMRHVSPRVVASGGSTSWRVTTTERRICFDSSANLPRPKHSARVTAARHLHTPARDAKAPSEIRSVNLSEMMRNMMRRLTNSVVVCTSSEDSKPRAMTMSSLTSLTLSPTPLVTFNIATPSRTLDAIRLSRAFNIHVPSGDAHGAKVADHFTKGNTEPDIFSGLESAGLQHIAAPDEAPMLTGEGILYVLKCTIVEDAACGGLVPVRDHVIVIGEVQEMIPSGEVGEDRAYGLAYADRKYRRLGSQITPNAEE